MNTTGMRRRGTRKQNEKMSQAAKERALALTSVENDVAVSKLQRSRAPCPRSGKNAACNFKQGVLWLPQSFLAMQLRCVAGVHLRV